MCINRFNRIVSGETVISKLRISWISFLAPEMQTSHGYYPVYLYYKKENKLILAYGLSETSEFSSTWPIEITNNDVCALNIVSLHLPVKNLINGI